MLEPELLITTADSATRLQLQTLGTLRLRGPDGDLLPRRRKELALVVVLAARAPAPVRREELIAWFWGERPEENARASMRHALLRLRRACGDALDITPDALRIVDDALELDARRFEAHVNEGRYTDAIELWTGDFLAGAEDAGEEPFRAWQDRERERLRRLLSYAYGRAVTGFEASRDASAMVDWTSRWVGHFPHDERAHFRHVEALCLAGRAAEAASVRAAFLRSVAADDGDEPSPEWLTQTERMIAETHAAAFARTAPLTPFPTPPVAPDAQPREASAGRRRTWRQRSAVVAVAAVALVLVAMMGVARATRSDRPLIALGRIDITGVPDTTAAIQQLLAIGLDGVAGLRVLGDGRLLTAQSALERQRGQRVDLRSAARGAGAQQILEGVLSRRPDGQWRLHLRRVALKDDEVVTTYRVEHAEIFDLIDRATQLIAEDFGAIAEATRFAGATTSLAAWHLYEEGLRAYYGGESAVASRLFRAALAADSTFAMAAYYGARVGGFMETAALLEQAVRMSAHAPDRVRLFIRVNWLASQNDPEQIAVAETLAVRYPHEPEALYEYARALITAGRFLEAVPFYRSVVVLDSLSLLGRSSRCIACDAYYGTVSALRFADSLEASEQVAREWLRRQPHSASAIYTMAGALIAMSRYQEASTLLVEAAARGDIQVSANADLWQRTADVETTDAYWRGLLAAGANAQLMDALVIGVSSMRMQGRLAEALPFAVRIRTMARSYGGHVREGYSHANILFAMGRYRESAALFDSIAADSLFARSTPRNGRHRAWNLTHAATAYAAARDTARLRVLEDTIRVQGALSGYRRDQLLFHYVRGLRLRLAGRNDEAIHAFRRSLYSPVEGHSRAALELARTLLDVDRPAEAVPVLRAAIAGPIGASGQYANRTELVYLIALAYDRTGEHALAIENYQWVVTALRKSDPAMVAMRTHALRRLGALRKS